MDSRGTIYGVYWKDCGHPERHFYEMEDAVEYCEGEIYKEISNIYDNFKFCVDEVNQRCCAVGYNAGFGNIMDYDIRAIDVY